jgi:hypothetical protein
MRRFVSLSFLIAAQVMPRNISTGGFHPESLAYRPHDPLNLTAFSHFYNLDYDYAVQEFEQVLARHPDDPFAVNHLLTVILFRELYRMGVLNTGEYANDSFISAPHHPADPKIKQQIQDLVARALQLEEKRLSANPNDVEALYARGVTRAQFATYTAMIERAWFSALRNAVGARHDHERVLELAPATLEAKLIVGAHNYVVGSLPWGVKVAASMVGLGGNKEKGLQYLKECAQGSGETSVDAQILLVLFLRREHRYDEARHRAHAIPRFPQITSWHWKKPCYGLPATIRKQRRSLRKIWQAGREGRYANLHYRVAAPKPGGIASQREGLWWGGSSHEQVNQVHKPDPEMYRNPTWAPARCTTCCKKRDWPWPSIKRFR